MSPKISIIIPVYNSAKYLRKCLDSVVNQTLHDLQIICVDRASIDGSRQILEDYAARDSRVEIVECENTPGGGPGQTRNAGIPHIRGKYTYFVDSDDWIDPTLCEKVYDRFEATGADVVFFFYQRILETRFGLMVSGSNEFKWSCHATPAEYRDYVPMIWVRVIRSSFFKDHDIRFPDDLTSEDSFVHLILCMLDPKIELIPEVLYHWYVRSDSTSIREEYRVGVFRYFALMKQYLLQNDHGWYEKERDYLLLCKMSSVSKAYLSVHAGNRKKVIQSFHDSLDETERDFIRQSPLLSQNVRTLLLYLIGDTPRLPFQVTMKIFLKDMDRVFLRKIIKPLKPLRTLWQRLENRWLSKYETRIRELNELLASRDRNAVPSHDQEIQPE